MTTRRARLRCLAGVGALSALMVLGSWDGVGVSAASAQEKVTPVKVSKRATRRGKKRRRTKKRTLKPATLIIVANFAEANATVNGITYPEYPAPDKPEGMLLPAGGPHIVKVQKGGKDFTYKISLRPYETRYLIVNPAASNTSSPSARPRPKRPRPIKRRPKRKRR